MIAVFVVGANTFQVENMVTYAREHYGSAEKYSDEFRLLDGAKKKKFENVLVFDREALDQKTVTALNAINVDVLCWKEDASMKSALRKKQEAEKLNKQKQEEREKNLREIRQMFN